jgi:signal transduction histidine kinase
MRLSHFILQNLELILQHWDEFAGTVDAAGPTLDAVGLRDHAEEILRTIALDMQSPQTSQQQLDKSRGLAPSSQDDTAANTHAVTRYDVGFTLDQMVSEYRALRSSVLRLWLGQAYSGKGHEIDDMVRFNEAVDQALGESITSYGNSVETGRAIMLGVLGHDLRTPLAAALLGTQLVGKNPALSDREKKLSAQVATSITKANQIVSSLLDLTRTSLGPGIPVTKTRTDLGSLCSEVVAELRACYPSVQIDFSGGGIGQFDSIRMSQLSTNLIANAIQHGDPRRPITVTLDIVDDSAWLSVHNYGEPIPGTAMPHIFKPQGRYSQFASKERSPLSGLGLGLFIAAEIVRGHGGHIDVKSSLAQGTTFRVALPIV